MPCAVRGERKDGGMGQHASSLGSRTQPHPRELRLPGRRQAVVDSKPGIKHRPVRVNHLSNRQVLPEHLLDVGRGLHHHALFQPGIVSRVELGIGLEHANPVQLQPLPGERIEEALNLRVGDHPVQLRGQPIGGVKFTALRRGEELLIRHRAPEEIGEPAGQLKVIHLRARLPGGTFFEIKEATGDQHARQG